MNRKEMLLRLEKGEDPLELCIEEWQNRGGANDTKHCALCTVNDFDCYPCIVFQKTDRIGCHGTPYTAYRDARTAYIRKEAAKREVEFLKSLRKET